MKPFHFWNLCSVTRVNFWSCVAGRCFVPGWFGKTRIPAVSLGIVAGLLSAVGARCQVLDTIGVSGLRRVAPGLTGAGVYVGQVETEASPGAWQVNPAAVGQPSILFSWIGTNGIETVYPNLGGSESWHANLVGAAFYGRTNDTLKTEGVAPGVGHVNSYDAGYFNSHFIGGVLPSPAAIINQSYIFGATGPAYETGFDTYAARFGTLFVNGVGNGGPVSAPATAFNGIGVGAYGGSSSVGPTPDGRCKPDITAPADFTSYSTPLVAGVATLLLQAAREGHGGSVNTATNALTLKTLLLNGATKPADWVNSTSLPLDTRYGAGIVHALNSYRQLRAGKKPFNTSTTVMSGGSHLPPTTTANLPGRRGWDHNLISSSPMQDAIHHYFFEVRGSAAITNAFTATLGWAKQEGRMMINNLDLYLYNVSNNVLVASSQSTANNVEHIYVPNLPTGRYALQVLKRTTFGLPATETYALGWDVGFVTPRIIHQAVSNGQIRAQVAGEPERTVVIQSSADYQTWTPILTNTVSAQGTFSFTNAASGTFRVFRAVQLE